MATEGGKKEGYLILQDIEYS